MAKVINDGSAKPDDPIYSTGPMVGGKRFTNLLKTGRQKSTPKQPLAEMVEEMLIRETSKKSNSRR